MSWLSEDRLESCGLGTLKPCALWCFVQQLPIPKQEGLLLFKASLLRKHLSEEPVLVTQRSGCTGAALNTDRLNDSPRSHRSPAAALVHSSGLYLPGVILNYVNFDLGGSIIFAFKITILFGKAELKKSSSIDLRTSF